MSVTERAPANPRSLGYTGMLASIWDCRAKNDTGVSALLLLLAAAAAAAAAAEGRPEEDGPEAGPPAEDAAPRKWLSAHAAMGSPSPA